MSPIQISNRQFDPVGDRRALEPDEKALIQQKSGRWFKEFGAGYGSLLVNQLNSPVKGAALAGVSGAAIGTALALAPLKEARMPLLAVCAITTAASMGFGYIGRKRYNNNVIDSITRNPKGATLRDMYADPVVMNHQMAQANRNAALSDGLIMAAGLAASNPSLYSSRNE